MRTNLNTEFLECFTITDIFQQLAIGGHLQMLCQYLVKFVSRKQLCYHKLLSLRLFVWNCLTFCMLLVSLRSKGVDGKACEWTEEWQSRNVQAHGNNWKTRTIPVAITSYTISNTKDGVFKIYAGKIMVFLSKVEEGCTSTQRESQHRTCPKVAPALVSWVPINEHLQVRFHHQPGYLTILVNKH